MFFLIVSSLFLAFLSLLVRVRFDNTLLWKVTIVATEAGHWFALSGICISVLALAQGTSGLIPFILSAISSWVLTGPVRKASATARTLTRRLERAFGPFQIQRRPFSFGRLLVPGSTFGRCQRLDVPNDDGRILRVDLYPATGAGMAPLVVVIHGGGWNNGDPDQLSDLNGALQGDGFAVASISYGLVPDHQWPQQQKDVVRCISYLRMHAATYGIDADQIVLLGRSAGGQLATHVAYSVKDLGIAGVIALYAPQDLEFAYRHSPPDDLIHSRRLLEEYLGGPYPERAEQYRDASPYFHVRKDVPPTLLLHGKHDLLTWYLQSFRLHRQLDRAGATNMYLEFSWATHGFDFFLNGPAGQLSRYAILAFLEAVTSHRSIRSDA